MVDEVTKRALSRKVLDVDDEVIKRVAQDLVEILQGAAYQGVDLLDPAVLARVVAQGAVLAAREVLGDVDATHFSNVWFGGDEGWKSGDLLPEMATRGGRSAPLLDKGYDIGTKFGAEIIACRACDTISYHPQHVEHLYCPVCSKFHRLPDTEPR